ncbi:M20/M25/M40 family metallo-hydrolase [Natranaerobius trueperi]|uniref:Peptidase M20 n=1 Tax=Natranaerobius trueperi TaxID=759412 RepID=A0A226C134_9FIRM|nr:M20/M25/M40 family metallo-hydrolase [Natranaerobius trueperi]OWZ84998.1 peptidase M20 [Natranaerobius trueperi]
MWLHDENKLLKLLYRLVKVPSISSTENERDMAREIYNILSEIPYFKEHEDKLHIKDILGDNLNRQYVTGLIKGSGNKTVILIHHHDVADVDDFGKLRDQAFDIEEITDKIASFELTEDAKKDLESGEWVFGRGVMDMKAGAALQLALMNDYSYKVPDLTGNILLLSVPDEENNSAGVIASLSHLLELQEQYALEFVSVIKSESHQPDSKGRHELAIGSIGKILPLFYCFGKETHGGSPFSGLNSSLIFSQVQSLMEKNTDFVDEFRGELTPPPVNLKTNDLRGVYNVTTPQVTVGYYNILTINSTPLDILKKLKKVGQNALENSVEIYNNRLKEFKGMSSSRSVESGWGQSTNITEGMNPQVYTFQELFQSAYDAFGDQFMNYYHRVIEELKETKLDEREFTVELVNKIHDMCPDREPKIVVAFLPPFYPHVRNRRETEKELFILDVVEKIKSQGKERYGLDFTVTEFFKGISDLSYFALIDGDEISNYLSPNMPSLRHVYNIPIEEIKKLDVSVLNVGPVGKDAHQYTERLHVPFFTKEAPKLLELAVNQVLKY